MNLWISCVYYHLQIWRLFLTVISQNMPNKCTFISTFPFELIIYYYICHAKENLLRETFYILANPLQSDKYFALKKHSKIYDQTKSSPRLKEPNYYVKVFAVKFVIYCSCAFVNTDTHARTHTRTYTHKCINIYFTGTLSLIRNPWGQLCFSL